MDLLLLPDLLAITLLLFVLFRFRDKRHDGTIRIWALGLLLILLEGAARILYLMRTPLYVHLLAHVVALAAYCLAGAVFIYSASQGLRHRPQGRALLALGIAPLLLLLVAYGFQVRLVAVYYFAATAGIATGVVPLLLKKSSPLNFALALLWVPLLSFILHGDYRSASYFGLAVLYGLSALYFGRSLPRGSQGKIAVVTGFSVWAICFLTHPWVATSHPAWESAVGQLWGMQKFVITVGLLIVLLEDQARSNEWLALHDELTGLPNRRLFEDRLQHALLQAARTKSRLALFNMDLDGFKQINDTLGHDAGDILLKGISHNLLGSLRRSDTLARLGGDEFTLIAADLDGAPGSHTGRLPGSCAAQRMPQVQRILTAMTRAAELPVCLGDSYDGHTVSVSASIGVVVFPDEASSQEELVRLADQRMYANKASRPTRSEPAVQEDCDDLEVQNV